MSHIKEIFVHLDPHKHFKINFSIDNKKRPVSLEKKNPVFTFYKFVCCDLCFKTGPNWL